MLKLALPVSSLIGFSSVVPLQSSDFVTVMFFQSNVCALPV